MLWPWPMRSRCLILPHTRRTDSKPDPHTAAAAATWSHADVWGTSQIRRSAAYAQFLYSSTTKQFTADCQSSADGYAELMTIARSVDPSACWVERRTENDHDVKCTKFAEIPQLTIRIALTTKV